IRDDGSSTSNVVEFNVVAHLTVGEHLVLVGNVAELGGWKVDVGRRMTWSEGDVWKTSISIPNAEASVEFKFVRYNDNNGVLTWQEGDNYACEL
ncbi:carbohydrate-binding module family 20 protein, partial [Micromonas commoda]